MNKIIINNQLVEQENANVSILDRGYQFGDGVYEVIRFYNGVLFKLEEHLQRFKRSTENIDIPFIYEIEKMKIEMNLLMKESGYNSGYIYAQITRGVGKRDHIYVGKEFSPQYVAYVVQEEQRPLQIMEEGIKVLIHEDIRWLKCDIKSLNLLGSILVKNKAVELGAKEAVLHRSGFVTEGGSTNVFVVKENVLYTHPANNLILDGITKNVVIEIANKYQIKVVEDAFTLDFFKDADEAFTTSSTAEIMPVISYLEFKNGVCEENTLGKGKRGEVTKFLQIKFGEEIS